MLFLTIAVFRFCTKVTPLDLLAQVVVSLGDNRRLYSAQTRHACISQFPSRGGECTNADTFSTVPCVLFLTIAVFRFCTKVTPLDLLAQVVVSLGDNRRLYSALTRHACISQFLSRGGECTNADTFSTVPCVLFLTIAVFRFCTKVTPLDLLAQVVVSLGDNRRLYSALTRHACISQFLSRGGECTNADTFSTVPFYLFRLR